MYKNKSIAVVIPVYNEENHIKPTVASIPSFIDYIYLINDCSTDSTVNVINTIQDKRIICLHNSKNLGAGASTIRGFKQCLQDSVDVIVKMDGDLQMDSQRIPDLLEPIVTEVADFSKGNRMSCKEHLSSMPKFRRFGNFLLKWLTRIATGNYQLNDPQNGYVAIKTDVLRQIDLDSVYPYYGYPNDLLVRLSCANARIRDVEMPAKYGTEKSHIKYSKFIPKVSMLLLRLFIWRLYCQYIRKRHTNVCPDC